MAIIQFEQTCQQTWELAKFLLLSVDPTLICQSQVIQLYKEQISHVLNQWEGQIKMEQPGQINLILLVSFHNSATATRPVS